MLTKKEAHSLIPREVFKFQVEDVGLNLAFYDPLTDKFYGIHREVIPIRVKVLPRDRDYSDFVGWQCESDTHDEPVEVIASFDTPEEIWDNLKIPQIRNGIRLIFILEIWSEIEILSH